MDVTGSGVAVAALLTKRSPGNDVFQGLSRRYVGVNVVREFAVMSVRLVSDRSELHSTSAIDVPRLDT